MLPKGSLDRVILPWAQISAIWIMMDGWTSLGTGDPATKRLLANRLFRNYQEARAFRMLLFRADSAICRRARIAFGDHGNNGKRMCLKLSEEPFAGRRLPKRSFRNPGHGNHWITLVLEGVKTNRAAFGARIVLTFQDQGVLRRVYRTAGYGSSFGGNPLRQHIGVGKAESIAKIEIFWPVSKTTQVFANVAVHLRFRVKEGASKLEPVICKQFAFNTVPMTKDALGMQH